MRNVLLHHSGILVLRIKILNHSVDYIYYICYFCTAGKVSLFGVFLVLIFPHSDLILKDTSYLSAFSPNAGNYRPEKL